MVSWNENLDYGEDFGQCNYEYSSIRLSALYILQVSLDPETEFLQARVAIINISLHGSRIDL